jgi:hypothetical protein
MIPPPPTVSVPDSPLLSLSSIAPKSAPGLLPMPGQTPIFPTGPNPMPSAPTPPFFGF